MSNKKKIAVLGGGMGSLSAVFEITNYPGWEEHYDITVYQMGWRLGGKLAIGRGPCDRIEEHGIHVFLGFYNNAFRLMQETYAERKSKNLDPGNPFQEWTQAFNKHSSIMLPHFSTSLGKWTNFTINFPENEMVPGEGPVPNHMDHLIKLLDWILKLEDEFRKYETGCAGVLIKAAIKLFLPQKTAKFAQTKSITPPKKPDFEKLKKIRSHYSTLKSNKFTDTASDIETIEKILDYLDDFLLDLQEALNDLHKEDGELYDFVIWAQLGVVNMKGIFKDKVFDPVTNNFNFDLINHLDYRQWLTTHGADNEVIYCAPVRDIYTLVFAYKNGDTSQDGQIAAGTALRGAMLIVLGYKGAVMYKFSSGTADVAISPMYQVLKSRGVKFEFFQKVKKIHHGSDKLIQKITMERQMKLRDGLTEYDPFYEVNKIQSWPSMPIFDQLDAQQVQQYKQLEAQEKYVNLESNWSAWQGETYELNINQDFDQVICGIAIGALKDICNEIKDNNQSWKDMLEQVATVQTQAVQLWLKPTLAQLGMDVTKWGMKAGDRPITDTYTNPINSWIDFTDLVEVEKWDPSNKPGFLVYYCGNLMDEENIPGSEDNNFPATQYSRVYETAIQWLSNNAGYFWPLGVIPENPQGINFKLLIDPHNPGETNGMKKMANQFFRANIDPSERYTLSLPGSAQYRLKADNTGYTNLFLAGDWIDCDLNMGCVEATVISGLMCAIGVRKSYGLETRPIQIDL